MNPDNIPPPQFLGGTPGLSFAFDVFPSDSNRTGPFSGSSESPIAVMMRNFVEILNRPSKHKHASKDAIASLKPIPLSQLPESERQCPICFDQFEDLDEQKVPDQPELSDSDLPRMFDGYDNSDPDVPFPTDQTGTNHITYHPGEEIEHKHAAQDPSSENAHYAVKLNQCGHIFGKSCVTEWLKSNVSCPLCRREIAPEMTESSGPDSNLVFYPIALTEVFVPISWSGPVRMGYALDDPAINFPTEGEGFSMGRRTGPEDPTRAAAAAAASPSPAPQQTPPTSERTGSGGPTRNSSSRPIRTHPYSRPSNTSSESEN
ncbi:hypothetical protein OGAPHI_005579 [Ogataea philodendri]|uniref:RING-type domain-containing protein n=1 Tax=Ogataea philodendri TaxID=1378263 RepID=A0A9P8T121_9ASCO|nr:uncharacterized protein OGAPHI_005579 [Ogataea philodendri]KAH3662328.1 hypothetical protein OGAPHI_005579 [Ogataea philodendri]